MNRFRLNQILEVLLFPVCDPILASKDFLFEEFNAYQNFLDIQGYGASETEKRSKLNKEFRSAEKNLLDYLLKQSTGNIKSYDDLKMLCHLYYPFQKIKRDNFAPEVNRCKEAMSLYYIHNLSLIATSLLTFRDGTTAIKTRKENNSRQKDIFDFSTIFNKVEIWNLLERMTVPDIYIAIHAVERGNGMQVLQGQQGSISLADKLLYQKIEKGIAENHIHANAGYSYEVLWLYEMNLTRWQAPSRHNSNQNNLPGDSISKNECRLLQAGLFRCAAAIYLESGTAAKSGFYNWLKNLKNKTVKNLLIKMHTDSSIETFTIHDRHSIADFYNSITGGKFIAEYDFLLESIYATDLKLRTSSEIIFLYKAYKHIKYTCDDTHFAHYFVQYLRIKNQYFQNIQEKHEIKGLLHFQKKYHNARNLIHTHAQSEKTMIEVFRAQNSMHSLKKLEIRIAPPAVPKEFLGNTYENTRPVLLERLYKQLLQVFSAYRQCILENLIGIRETRDFLTQEKDRASAGRNSSILFRQLARGKKNVPTLGIIFHFLKGSHLNDTSGYFCWRSIIDKERLNTEYRLVTRWNMQNISLALQEIRCNIPFISEYIVGIDAASDENAMEPWMFAPAYRMMHLEKNAKIETDKFGYQNIQNMRFTYHVGEDFRHILSGLRHLDEVIEEFHYQTGDRLGHALALGINIDKWIAENEVVPIPIGEYLDNLLWVWGKNTYEEIDLPIQLEILENKIISIAEKLYLHPETLTVRMLYQAYKKKFENHSREYIEKQFYKFQEKESNSGNKHSPKSNSHFCYFENENQCFVEWTAEKLCLTNYCPVFEEKYNEIDLIAVQKSDGTLLKTLQQYLIEKTERLGIFVETNPTSNLTIGDFSQMKDHPLFRLSTIGNESGNHIQIMVNSDNPVIFNTNVENELAYIYYAAEYQGHSKEHVLAWVDTIRQNGLDGSFVLEEKEPWRILDEVEQIMEALSEKRGLRI